MNRAEELIAIYDRLETLLLETRALIDQVRASLIRLRTEAALNLDKGGGYDATKAD